MKYTQWRLQTGQEYDIEGSRICYQDLVLPWPYLTLDSIDVFELLYGGLATVNIYGSYLANLLEANNLKHFTILEIARTIQKKI